MKVLVTRPAAQAAEWVAQLAARGIDAAALPLIGIAAPADRAAVEAAWHALAGQALVVFVSPNAAEQFFALRPVGAAWPAHVIAGSPGPGTTQALCAQGVPPGQIVAPAADAPQFDSEALWAQLEGRDWQRAGVTIVRGDGGREWLADTLRSRGAAVSFVTAYRRVPPTPMRAGVRCCSRRPESPGDTCGSSAARRRSTSSPPSHPPRPGAQHVRSPRTRASPNVRAAPASAP